MISSLIAQFVFLLSGESNGGAVRRSFGTFNSYIHQLLHYKSLSSCEVTWSNFIKTCCILVNKRGESCCYDVFCCFVWCYTYIIIDRFRLKCLIVSLKICFKLLKLIFLILMIYNQSNTLTFSIKTCQIE